MSVLNPSMRLKVNRDTFFIPDSTGGAYFRNNSVTFRMEGRTIDQWIEQLLPMFNGNHTLHELTDGLQSPHRDRVYEIAEVLYQNGFVRDLSADRPHQLPADVLGKYASQIEFLDSLGQSGAYRFQNYRQSKVLAIGSGPFFVSLVAALLESGLPRFHMLITDSEPTHRQRLTELAEHARQSDSSVAIEEISFHKDGWREGVRSYDAILYVSQNGELEELRLLHAVCREESKVLLPALIVQQAGLAGPLVHPEADGCWESAFRRLHQSAISKDPQLHTFSVTAGAMLANIIVFEWLKRAAGVTRTELSNKFFLLDLETLEGGYHSFLPHPLVHGHRNVERVDDLELRLKHDPPNKEFSSLFPYFMRLTSPQSGIFQLWEEEDLIQLPLSQCRVQAVDPLTEGPAEQLADIVCSGLTHEEARREAGLAGIEAYVSRWICSLGAASFPGWGEEGNLTDERKPPVAVGAGATMTEGLVRALQAYLNEELRKQLTKRDTLVSPLRLDANEDRHCRYYWQALTTMQRAPEIGCGEEIFGFPVVWAKVEGRWYGSAGLNRTLAWRHVLQQALMSIQNKEAVTAAYALVAESVLLEEKAPQSMVIPAHEEAEQADVLHRALTILESGRQQLMVYDLSLEPFMNEELAGVFGVLLREEASA
ncbi:putative thiazole-containing bacteriocin maturation protein [Paenibacillus sp. J2TS4]|uniref:putative thiazole-containing bacteriocin maturation protein n=1 Tax=Paenibacillus sp. J2TS4 TaxID=2807194 RepID=UPI001B211E80|nr:putative thiazole-containing bacteriocin maturation protein [Paenibacillus sp. J2TS4]GIP33187.1 putative thiazole-containing bacteriocin maturation protein [Paenibacillus sp. J2TS4]